MIAIVLTKALATGTASCKSVAPTSTVVLVDCRLILMSTVMVEPTFNTRPLILFSAKPGAVAEIT